MNEIKTADEEYDNLIREAMGKRTIEDKTVILILAGLLGVAGVMIAVVFDTILGYSISGFSGLIFGFYLSNRRKKC